MPQNDPYAKYGGHAAPPAGVQQASPASDPYARYGGHSASAPASSQPQPAPSQPGFFGSFGDASGLSTLWGAATHPLNTASTVLDAGKRLVAPNQPVKMSDNPNPLLSGIGRVVDNTRDSFNQGVADYKKNGLSLETRRDFGRAIPIVGPALAHAQSQQDAGNTPGMLGTLSGTVAGAVGPELLKAAPGTVGTLLRSGGDALQDSGANRMDRFLNGGKPLPVGEYDAPGKAVLDAGPSTSMVVRRPSLAPKIAAAKTAAAPAIDAAAASSPGRVQLVDMRNAVDSTIAPLKRLANGPGGNPGVAPRLDNLRDSFGPTLDLNGSASAPAMLDLRRTLDSNINWNRGPDPIDATARNATRQIRGKLNDLFYQASPEVKAPSQVYGNLADAQDLAEDNADTRDMRLGSLRRMGADVVLGGGAGLVSHDPAMAIGTAAVTHGLPMLWKAPLTQTGLATGAYQLGRGMSAAASAVESLSPSLNVGIDNLPALSKRLALPALAAPTLTPQHALPAPLQQQAYPDQGPQNQIHQNDQSQQLTPPGVSSLRLLDLVPPSYPARRLSLPAPILRNLSDRSA